MFRRIVASTFCAVLSAACSDVRLRTSNDLSLDLRYINVDATFCTSGRYFGSEKVKYLFILDHSSSNQPGFPLSPNDVTGTDPLGARRYGVLAYFISQLNSQPNVEND